MWLVGSLQRLRRFVWNIVRTLDEVRELPKMRTQLDQCLTIQRMDAKHAGRLDKALNILAKPSVQAHVKTAVDAAKLDSDPCPHIVIDSLLPDVVYDTLLAAIPPGLFFDHVKSNRQDLSVPFELAPRYHREVWARFQKVVITQGLQPALVSKFGRHLDELVHGYWPAYGSMAETGIYPGPARRSGDASRTRLRDQATPDPRWAFLTCILYLTRRDDTQTYGTQLCRLQREREAPSHSPFYVDADECEVVREVPGRPNTAVAFLNSTGVHQASIPPDAPPDTDRYIYQLQLGPSPSVRDELIGALPEGRVDGWSQKTANQALKH